MSQLKRAIFIFLGETVKNFKKTFRWLKYTLSILLLALVCVGTVELVVCSYQSPELYKRITAPVRAGLQRAAEFNQYIWSRLSTAVTIAADNAAIQLQNSWEELMTRLEPEPEPAEDIQLVDSEEVAPPPRPIASFSITTLICRNSQEYLTGGARELFYYNQTADLWAEGLYGTDSISGYGCGPTAMAMVVSTLTGTPIDPVQMSQHCVDNGYWARRQGSYRTIVQGVAEDFGLVCESLSLEDQDDISRRLATGQLVVALMGPGHFTNGGHFIVLRGVTLDGSILVADPASSDRSLTTWELDLILEELSASRHSGGPLWAVSAPF